MMKKILFFVLSLFLIFNVSANTTSSNAANRKTALRYLQLAKHYGTQNDWNAVQELCQNGLQYDTTVADLHYLNALSLFNLSHPRYVIISAIEKALSETQWVDYNLENARVFYADLLCDTGNPQKALEVLDTKPLIFSADAEYVRAKSLFQINTQESITKAEEKIDSARRVYPKDVRFFYLFFDYEYNLCYVENADKTAFEKKELSPIAKKIADSFILNIPNYDKNLQDLEILASFFAEGETKKRLLKAFDARGFKYNLYPIFALQEGIISQEEAVDYFIDFINGTLDAKVLTQFYTLITEENPKKYLDEHLNAFSGILVYDTNNTLESNLTVAYQRGRPKTAIYDYNNDQSIEWEVEFDFGEPKIITVYDQMAIIYYSTYPNVNSIVFEDLEPSVKGQTIYNIIDESYQSVPFDIIKNPMISTTDFFVIDEVTLSFGKSLFDSDKIVQSVNIMDKPSLERSGARIQFSVIDGVPYEASYYVNNTIYATAHFFDRTDDCVIRKIDKDEDGIFEVVEYYSVIEPNDVNSKNIQLNSQFKKDSLSITKNLWGTSIENASIYLSKVKIDLNLDTVPDFSEEYLLDGTKISRWDNDYNTEIDAVYKKFPLDKDNNIREENSYLIDDSVNGKIWVTVVLNNQIPISIIQDENLINIFKGIDKNIYWLSEQVQNENYELDVKQSAMQYKNADVFQIEQIDCYLRVIKIDSNIFVKKIDKVKNDNSVEEAKIINVEE